MFCNGKLAVLKFETEIGCQSLTGEVNGLLLQKASSGH